ncbi:cilia- and flagella-associated protein 299-like [Diachasma alloeum]|uniref:cilia- and flagella-associated protein 299-like n=1 Tax=Diachasma alloeum TaxID=454923 RepID=UPI0007383486|nr:cilia- and flagella-associated protein 299-like [Diachasma alloeum]
MATKGTQLDNDKHLLKFSTYEEYLDSLVTQVDLDYLRNTETARLIAELGYKSTGETLDREAFHDRRNIVKDLLFPVWRPFTLDSELTNHRDPLIIELSLRERANRLGTLSTIIFVKIITKSGFEVSGYIDFAHRLRRENWKPFFEGRRKLRPGKSDLSYYHWKTKKLILNGTDNYEPVMDVKKGILLKNLKDLKFVDLDPKTSPGVDTFRLRVESRDYQQVVLYDHVVRCRL